MKLISICPSNTELVGYLGLTSSLIAVDNYSDWPEEVSSLPRLGSDLNIDMDKVEELQPDLVLASLSVPGMERNIEELEKRKIPYVIVPNPKSLTEVGETSWARFRRMRMLRVGFDVGGRITFATGSGLLAASGISGQLSRQFALSHR